VAIDAKSSLADVCFEVCTALDLVGFTAVLTGGSAATIYAPAAYQSRDADFIITLHGAGGAEVLARLGYAERGGTYEHAENQYTLEFPRGPLSIGDDLVTAWDTRRRADQILHILTRTDCVRDRLMWFYTDNDRSALNAAIGVAQSGVIDRDAIREWSAREGFASQCEQFFSSLPEHRPCPGCGSDDVAIDKWWMLRRDGSTGWEDIWTCCSCNVIFKENEVLQRVTSKEFDGDATLPQRENLKQFLGDDS
jgi:hypothetical protein